MIQTSFIKLKTYCEKEKFKGWDPYDGLNSKIFNLLPIKSKWLNIIWIQIFKKNPINFRKLFLISKGYNSKGVALFLSGYCNLHKIAESGDLSFGSEKEIIERIKFLADLLVSLKSKGYSGACWGYNFDWQSLAFFLPKNTPTVVATSFVVDSLFKAYEITKNEIYKQNAISSADFVLNDLNRIKKENGLYMFSYSPLDKRAVYNATLLGSKILAQVYKYTKNENLKLASKISIQAVCNRQKETGAFPHSDQVGDDWKDSFHTGFKLECISIYSLLCKDTSFDINVSKGINYWLKNFFLDDGTPKYYDNNIYPIDLHCPAQMIPTLYHSRFLNKNITLVEKVLGWCIDNMQDIDKGYFYFQKTKYFKNKICYSRWPNAWMFYGMSFYLLNLKNVSKS